MMCRAFFFHLSATEIGLDWWAIIWDSILAERVTVFPRKGEDGGGFFLCVFLCDMRLNFSLLYLFFLGLGFACGVTRRSLTIHFLLLLLLLVLLLPLSFYIVVLGEGGRGGGEG